MRLALAVCFALASVTDVRAQLPPQIRPITPELFVGDWDGNWYDNSGTVGGLNVTIRPPQGDTLRVLVRATNAIALGFGAEAVFVNGELILDEARIRIILKFRLHGDDRLEADYHYRDRPNTGVWSLVRKGNVGK